MANFCVFLTHGKLSLCDDNFAGFFGQLRNSRKFLPHENVLFYSTVASPEGA